MKCFDKNKTLFILGYVYLARLNTALSFYSVKLFLYYLLSSFLNIIDIFFRYQSSPLTCTQPMIASFYPLKAGSLRYKVLH